MKKAILALLTTVALCGACTRSITFPGADEGAVRITAITDDIIHVEAVPAGASFSRTPSLAVIRNHRPYLRFRHREEADAFVLETGALRLRVAKSDGSVSYYRLEDDSLIAAEEARSFSPVTVEGRQAWTVRQTFLPQDEGFYGLGQHQADEWDYKGRNEELYQYNTKISVPFVVSSRRYGILWDSYSLCRWGDPRPYASLGEVFTLRDKDGVEGALTGTYIPASGEPLVKREDSLYYENEFAIQNLPDVPLNGARVIYEGWIEAPETADYDFIQYYAGFQQTTLGGQEMMSRRWRPAWNPNSYKFTAHLEKGVRTPVRIEWEPDGGVSYFGLRVAPLLPSEEKSLLSFWSEFEPQVDFYFMAGRSYDDVIQDYRTLTGKAPVMPKWVLGFWQSRERYSTQEEVVRTLAEFRRRHIPVDNIVQDWQYWKDDQWGSHEFDETRYPDPEKMMDDVHALNGRLMISVWPKFYTNTENYKELKAAGYAYTHAEDTGLVDWLGHKQTFYDAYAEGGRKMFWRQIDEDLYSKYGRKIDAWWMDASEPNLRDCLPMDYFKWLITPTALGPSTEYLNAYSLVNADAIYNGQRNVEPDRRVFLLTRSGFAGLQRYSTATWSGDIGTSWTDMRIQMAAGLDFSMSGIPFWGMDIGGFSVMSKFYNPANLEEWRELQTRWHQFGTFVPLFRTHGQWPARELWNIAPAGSKAYESILWYMQLRYRLMPYLYSMAGAVHFDDYTIMRGLPMDFPDDPEVRDLSDQWMFGPALMACPVSEYKARSRNVYFPEGGWYDFYTGEYFEGGRSRSIPAPYERMPLFVRAGSIIPFGPEIEWTGQKPDDDICLYIYAGADAHFDLYEDDGESYAYERGAYSVISISWDDAKRELTFSPRKGSFPGMLESRRFRIVVVDPAKPHGYDPDAEDDYTNYLGELFFTTIR